MPTVKLSELPADTQLSYEDAPYTISANDLIEKIGDGEDLLEHTWYVAVEKRWKPDAKYMLDQYIENEYHVMYEDWDKRAKDCLKQEHYDRIQVVLDEAFKGDHATKYWMLDGPEVIIDFLPE
ncbi:hypothetical protein ABES58_04360 [Paenibacillus lautus]|uniref:hypothetical protein n=1 Tax=Paenibacillus lautus TaxID=1401 RepID=UPI003D29A9E3